MTKYTLLKQRWNKKFTFYSEDEMEKKPVILKIMNMLNSIIFIRNGVRDE